ncbi:hypothetical protein [Sphingosinicella terrae]|uniref:hypothetical protein n=1 Tax=Sphingosinicella terrae TaxID=2172047 RepID=UPI000E0DDB49|nr:hypothetical protein [Sphingosinicella terrae]
MAALFALALQAASAPPPIMPLPFDLRTIPSDQGRGGPETCGETEGDEILVCGRRRDDERYRVRMPANPYAEAPVRAGMGLGGGATAVVQVQSVEFPAGQISKRALVTIRVPF